jgi:DNA-binding GntR family transcriptional regulator
MTEVGTKGLVPMNIESKGSRAADSMGLERAIILQLLRDDHEQRWSREQLMAELGSDREILEETLKRLAQEGVLGISEEAVWASSAVRRMDELELIGI